jgi:hypothetical protein
MASRNYGLVGIDASYVLALMGTIFMAIFFVVGNKTSSLQEGEGTTYFVFLDFFPAMLVFMSGYTFSIKMRDRKTSSRSKLSNSARKGSLMFFVGLLFVGNWPVNMFIALGMFYMAASLLGQMGNFMLRTLAVVCLMISVICINLEVDPMPLYGPLQLQGAGVREFVAYFLFNGYYSFLPWFVFFLAGMVFGRGNIRPNGWFPPSSFVGLGLMLLSILAEMYSKTLYSPISASNVPGIYPLNIRNFVPSFVLLEVGMSVVMVNSLNYLFRKTRNRRLSDGLRKLVEARYSVYLTMLLAGSIMLGLFSVTVFSQSYLLLLMDVIVCIACAYAMLLWKRNLTAKPPMEWLISRVTSSARS